MVPIGHTTPLRSGQVSYVMRRFELEEFLKHVERYQITELFLVPPIIVSIVMSPLVSKYSLKSVRWGQIGGAPLDTTTQAKFKALVSPDGAINQAWGMTEISCLGSCFYWPEFDTTGSIGRFLPNLEVKYALWTPWRYSDTLIDGTDLLMMTAKRSGGTTKEESFLYGVPQ